MAIVSEVPVLSAVPVRPVWRPGLHRLWRSATDVQLGVDPERAVVVGGLAAPLPRLLDLIDGTRDRRGLLAAAQGLGVPAQAASSVLALLGQAGALADAAREPAFADLPSGQRERLAPEAAARGPGDAGLARRRSAAVLVVGGGRVGATIARLLGASGVGTVSVADQAPARPTDLVPGGLDEDALGAPRDVAVHRLLPPRPRGPLRQRHGEERPDLVVLAPAEPLSGGLGDRWRAAGVPHLAVTVRDAVGVVGPLVAPGATACLRCLDHHRTDRDAAWPRVAAQLAGVADPVPVPVALAAAVAALAAEQVLAALEEPRRSLPVHGGTLERAARDWRWRRRSWAMHPLCDCSGSSQAGRE